MPFEVTNWPVTNSDTFNPCTNTLFLWDGGVPPFRLSYTFGNISGQCADSVSTQGAWWPIDSITGYQNTTSEWSDILFTVSDSTGATTPSVTRPVAFSSVKGGSSAALLRLGAAS